jgi:flavodoxin
MESMVVYGSRSGNTQKVAEAIAGALEAQGPVQVVAIDEAKTFPAGTELVVIGGPTEAHRMTPPVALFLDGLQAGALTGIAVAAFDTRLRWPRWLSGSAAAGIVEKLRDTGGSPIAAPESFFVHGKEPQLEPGELERAATWGATLAALVAPKATVPA